MSRSVSLATLVVVAALVVLAVGAVTAVGADQHAPAAENQSQVVTVVNTSNALALDGPTRQSYVRADIDAAGATAVSAERLQGAHDARTFEHRYERSAQRARVGVVDATVDHTEQKLDRLNAKQDRLYRSYANRSISRETLVRRLAVIEAEATQVERLRGTVQETVEDDIGTSLPVTLNRRVSALEADIVGLPSPVSSSIVSAVSGQSEPVRAYASGSAGGMVLARVDAEGYVRQATVRTAYAPDQPNQFEGAITDAYQQALDLYPWVATEALNGPNLVERGMGVYRVNAEHPHGELTTYIHGATGAAFHEIQRKYPGSVPVTRTISNETTGLNLTIERTTATGPMHVTVREPDGDPVSATVSINRQVVGTTDSDGELWTIQPSGGFRVNATADGDSVVVIGP